MKNKMEDLRNHLFATIEALQDKDKPMEIERAKAISEVAGKLIESAKVEVSVMKLTGSAGTGFIPADKPQLPGPNGAKKEPPVRTHRIL